MKNLMIALGVVGLYACNAPGPVDNAVAVNQTNDVVITDDPDYATNVPSIVERNYDAINEQYNQTLEMNPDVSDCTEVGIAPGCSMGLVIQREEEEECAKELASTSTMPADIIKKQCHIDNARF